MAEVGQLVRTATMEREERLGFDMSRERWRLLFAELADGRQQALADLYDIAAEKLFGLALWATRSRDDAADVVADTFVRVAEQRHRLRDVRDPRAWLLTLTRRLTIDLARRHRVRKAEPLEAAELLAAPADDPDRAADACRASQLLAELPAKQREVVFLHHFAEQSFASIGAVVGVPTFTAASRYRLAIRRLRRLLEDSHEA